MQRLVVLPKALLTCLSAESILKAAGVHGLHGAHAFRSFASSAQDGPSKEAMSAIPFKVSSDGCLRCNTFFNALPHALPGLIRTGSAPRGAGLA